MKHVITKTKLQDYCLKHGFEYWVDNNMWEVQSATHRLIDLQNQKWWRKVGT